MKKKLLSIFLFLSMMASAVSTMALSNEKGTQKYDIDGNGTLEYADVSALIDIILSNNSYDTKWDLNNDDKVNIADVVFLISTILGNSTNIDDTQKYFYLGTTKPTEENYKTLPGMATSYASLEDAGGMTISVDADEILYLLCPAEWMTEKYVQLEDEQGNIFTFEDVDDIIISGYVIYKTQAWTSTSVVTLKTGEKSLFQKVIDDVSHYLTENRKATFQDLRTYLEKYEQQLSSKVEDDMMVITMQDGSVLDVDLYGLSSLQPTNWDNYDRTGIETFAQEIRENLGFSDDDYQVATRRSLSRNMLSSLSDSKTAKDVYVNRDVLIWAPEEAEVSEVKKKIKEINDNLKSINKKNKGITIKDVKKGRECTPSSMGKFNQYGLVFVLAHGRGMRVNTESSSKEPAISAFGHLLLPTPKKGKLEDDPVYKELKQKHLLLTFDETSGNKDNPIKKYYALDYNCLKHYLPNLSNTIVWTAVCYAQTEGSETKKGFESASPAFFAGSNTKAFLDISINKFAVFAELFYFGDEARKAWRESSPISDTYIYTFSGSNTYVEDYKDARAIKPENNNPRVSCIMPTDHLTVSASRGTDENRSLGYNEGNVGISFKNESTSELKEFLIDESKVKEERRYDYKGLTHLILKVSTDDLAPGTYEYRTYLEIDGDKTYSDDVYEFTKGAYKSCPDGAHPHMIDLGLPSGTLWACCNVGAKKPEAYGKHFAWGEVTPKYKFNRENYQWHDGTDYIFIGNDIAGTEYDAAHNQWGGSWKMPTVEQCRELWDNCSKVMTKQNGIEGKVFTGPNGGSIFLPFSGWSGKYGPVDDGYNGFYWTSTFIAGDIYSSNSYDLDIAKSVNYNGVGGGSRFNGRAVRPVSK